MVCCKKCKNFVAVTALERQFYTDCDTDFQGLKKVCPICGNDEFSKAQKCPRCKKFHVEKEDICSKCAEELKAELQNFLKNYSDAEQEAMLF